MKISMDTWKLRAIERTLGFAPRLFSTHIGVFTVHTHEEVQEVYKNAKQMPNRGGSEGEDYEIQSAVKVTPTSSRCSWLLHLGQYKYYREREL
jgi:hypothetical protein